MTITLIISLFCALLTAPPSPAMVMFAPPEIKPYEALWNATCAVESNFNPYAIGDKHMKRWSYGIVQIRKSRLDDYYRQTGIRYTVTDMFDTDKSKEVFMYYCTGTDLERISREWNGGNRGMQKKSTKNYWKQIQKRL